MKDAHLYIQQVLDYLCTLAKEVMNLLPRLLLAVGPELEWSAPQKAKQKRKLAAKAKTQEKPAAYGEKQKVRVYARLYNTNGILMIRMGLND